MTKKNLWIIIIFRTLACVLTLEEFQITLKNYKLLPQESSVVRGILKSSQISSPSVDSPGLCGSHWEPFFLTPRVSRKNSFVDWPYFHSFKCSYQVIGDVALPIWKIVRSAFFLTTSQDFNNILKVGSWPIGSLILLQGRNEPMCSILCDSCCLFICI